MPAALDRDLEWLLPEGIVPFPRGFSLAVVASSTLPLASVPLGGGDNAVVVFDGEGTLSPRRVVTDPELSPLDLTIAPNGNIVASSEFPFGSPDAIASVGEYDTVTGHLLRVFKPDLTRVQTSSRTEIRTG